MTISFARHHFPPAIIWITPCGLYRCGLALVYRDVEDLLAERGLDMRPTKWCDDGY